MPNNCKSKKSKTNVVVISSLHQFHKDHDAYGYDALYDLIGSFNPEYIGIEIRKEDISLAEEYLKNIYSQEMIEINRNNPEKVFGVDWFEQDLEGKQTPADYFQKSRVIQLMGKLNEDAVLPNKIQSLNEKKIELIKSSAPSCLYNGEYDSLCEEVARLQAKWLVNTPYRELVLHREERNEKMAKNIEEFVKDRKPGNVVIVVGADHRGPIMKKLIKNPTIELNSLEI